MLQETNPKSVNSCAQRIHIKRNYWLFKALCALRFTSVPSCQLISTIDASTIKNVMGTYAEICRKFTKITKIQENLRKLPFMEFTSDDETLNHIQTHPHLLKIAKLFHIQTLLSTKWGNQVADHQLEILK